VLFDKRDPRRVLARADKPFMLPTLDWEKTGNVPNVIFLEGAVKDTEGNFTGYYGAADKYTGSMRITVTHSAMPSSDQHGSPGAQE
jgi:predicted GH43/DUF377 family glycosyl hydrolase